MLATHHWMNDREYFFKYVRSDTARVVLQNGTLRWSTPGTLNDPYDLQFDLHIEVDRERVKILALQKLWDAHYGSEGFAPGNSFGEMVHALRGDFPQLPRDEFDRKFGEAFDESLAQMDRHLPQVQADVRVHIADSKILCLTETPDSTVMWTHYADQHQGAVLRFKSIPELDSAWGAARAVNYCGDMPRLFDDEFLADMLSGRRSLDVPTVIDRLVYTKSGDWAYEREWRVFAGAGRQNAAYEDLPFHPCELDAVIFGCRMAEADRECLVALLQERYPHAAMFQACKSERQFRIEIRPLKAA